VKKQTILLFTLLAAAFSPRPLLAAEVSVFAAASLTEALNQLAGA